ncbi:uncharacterized protein I303_106508 [Kwoniella dejecticola CBS 10117]|uniref:Protein BTN n=1 Tax=Kwoniella dejecticola CBS 10117 TaxID=1296121 RepID=A0A1A5ZUH8_9TREE|nr:protein BTN1 [Kwoniella dejecticola CBS 10117]OBR81464.1 protein BTN1 [Kwoniella dejecticola CBS 10117]
MGPDIHERRPLQSESHARANPDVDDYDEDEDVDDFIAANEEQSLKDVTSSKHTNKRLFAAFMIFGLLNNVLYVIILSAALDLVSSSTPKGIVALFNIFPALLTKVVWPIISNGKIQYTRRVGLCTCVSWLGIMTIAFSSSLAPRLLGISMASLSSGLGELTFLQLTTTLPTRSTSKTALGAWSSGTGFAGIAGAGIWWLLRGLGVKGGLGLSSILPLFFPITYQFLLPSHAELEAIPSNAESDSDSSGRGGYEPINTDSIPPSIFITPPSQDVVPQLTIASGARSREQDHDLKPIPEEYHKVYLTTQEKLDLLKPLILRYMVPLCAVYVEEYVINSGVAPTLVFPLPTRGIWSKLFKSPRDYYPFWSLTYQTFVFLSRSSISLSLPPLPLRFLPFPSIIQFIVLSLLFLQARFFLFSSSEYTPPAPAPSEGVDRSITIVFLLICIEGLCGGLAYVNTFYHVQHEGEEAGDNSSHGINGIGGVGTATATGTGTGTREEKMKMQKEFRIGAVGAADSTGILFAALISMPLELSLCNSQIEQGRTTCRDL